MSVTHLHGDCREVLATLPDKSVQCVVTSPPYWGLRDYGVSGQLGLEKTPDEYVANMVAVFREVKRALRDDGTLWLNLGDSYASGEIGRHDGGRTYGDDYDRKDFGPRKQSKRPDGIKPKDLVGIPWRVAFALQADGWYLRSDIIWHKPNPMPESVSDRPTKAHEYVFLLTKSASYFYDADAIREPQTDESLARYKYQFNAAEANTNGGAGYLSTKRGTEKTTVTPAANGRNRRSVWTVATRPYKGAHFATFPPKLIEPCILAGTSPQACEHCAAPWERVMERERGDAEAHERPKRTAGMDSRTSTLSMSGNGSREWAERGPKSATVGWQPTCDCADNTGAGRCVVLDPFGGSGTTAAVAEQHGRDSILIELNESYIDLQRERMAKVQPQLVVA